MRHEPPPPACAGPSEDALVAKITQHEEIIAQYAGVRNRTAEKGVERAQEVVTTAQAALVTLRAAKAKVAAIEAEFDARGFEVRPKRGFGCRLALVVLLLFFMYAKLAFALQMAAKAVSEAAAAEALAHATKAA